MLKVIFGRDRYDRRGATGPFGLDQRATLSIALKGYEIICLSLSSFARVARESTAENDELHKLGLAEASVFALDDLRRIRGRSPMRR